MKENIIVEKSYRFAVEMTAVSHKLKEKKGIPPCKPACQERDQHWRKCKGGNSGTDKKRFYLENVNRV